MTTSAPRSRATSSSSQGECDYDTSSSSSDDHASPAGFSEAGASSEKKAQKTTESKRLTLPGAIKLIYVTLAFTPRLALYGLVFGLGQICRALAKLFCSSVGAPHLANKRILYISDYMPPQCHGIALRVSQYTKHLRAAGHEVHVYTCCVESRARTSFDHPTLPYVANPFNSGNQISYSVGIKLAWALGAESWDVVHVFYPNCLGLFVLPACRWRGIASYCSHHVSMDEYALRYIDLEGKWPFLQWLCRALYSALYDACYRLPASYWGDVNASMTRTFVHRHLPHAAKYSHVATIGSGVDVQRFNRLSKRVDDGPLQDDDDDDAACSASTSGRRTTTRVLVDQEALLPDDDVDRRQHHQRRPADDDEEHKEELPSTPKKKTNEKVELGWLWLEACASEREALCRRIGAPTEGPTRVWVMVQRLAPEKDTHVALEALAALKKENGAEYERTWLVIAGDGPARESLERRARELFKEDDQPSRVTFLGAVKNERLPALYRSADVFITCSRSETFGLTVTEALASGATVALPRCAVFDELYGERLPSSWRYDADDPRGPHLALLDAVADATHPSARAWLAKHPVDASWAAAAADLDRQYSDAIQRGKTKYTNVRQYAQKRAIHLGRASLLAVSLYYVLSIYYRSFYCHVNDCHVFLPSLPRPVRAVCLFTAIVALEWCHC